MTPFRPVRIVGLYAQDKSNGGSFGYIRGTCDLGVWVVVELEKDRLEVMDEMRGTTWVCHGVSERE